LNVHEKLPSDNVLSEPDVQVRPDPASVNVVICPLDTKPVPDAETAVVTIPLDGATDRLAWTVKVVDAAFVPSDA
jgi:hypothetical protein